jgi:hypothetical protein
MTKKRILGCLRVPPVEYHWFKATVFRFQLSVKTPGPFFHALLFPWFVTIIAVVCGRETVHIATLVG